ncbi:hypothetical protein MMC13_003494 [Lambiella insularis]|nr:hypothetical protein [Lambiella insularis]
MASHQSAQEDAFHGILYPVFCTADIPAKVSPSAPKPSKLLSTDVSRPQILTKLLTNVQSLSDSFTTGLYFVRSKKVTTADTPEATPCHHFRSPFVSTPLPEIVSWFDAAINERTADDRLAVNSLIVLDERTLADENTCLVVSTLGEETRTARAEFFVAVEVLQAPEMGPRALNEGFTEEEQMLFKRVGEWWYTKEAWMKWMGGDEE